MEQVMLAATIKNMITKSVELKVTSKSLPLVKNRRCDGMHLLILPIEFH
jgi:hypothetical protein